jgi:hypothetical protein
MLNNQQNGKLNIRTMSVLAMFTAISVVLTRFLVIQPMPSVRFELGNVPIMLAGFMYGPVAGIIVGAIADFVGAIIRGQGFDIPLMLVPMFMGCMAGLVRNYIVKNLSYIKILGFTFTVNVIGKMLWTTYWLSIIFGRPFMEILPIRIGVYTIIPIIEAAVIFGLLSNAAFRRIVLRGE